MSEGVASPDGQDAADERPAIVCMTEQSTDVLRRQFGRYAEDYAVHIEPSPRSAVERATALAAAGVPIAMLVLDTTVGTDEVKEAMRDTRLTVPTARRLAVTPWESFREHSRLLRRKLAIGAFDAHLLMPRGSRDEEFHSAVVDLLNEWGATIAAPQVEVVRIVAPPGDVVTRHLCDYLSRMGSPHGVHAPESAVGRDITAQFNGMEGDWPLVSIAGAAPFHCLSSPGARPAGLRPVGRDRHLRYL